LATPKQIAACIAILEASEMTGKVADKNSAELFRA
jgi:hypothetical protein